MATVTAPSPETGTSRAPARLNWIERNHFWLRRLHSLSGIVPVGGFLLFHFYENGAIFSGADAYNQMSIEARDIRYLALIEIFVIFLPLLYHALYGLYIAANGRDTTLRYNYGRNTMFMWQRITGIVTLLFILYHVWVFRFTAFWTGHADASVIAANFSKAPIFIFYLVGIVAASFHLGNGIWTFLITWGFTVGARSQRISQWITTGISILVALIGVAIAVAFVQLGGGLSWSL